MHYIQLSLIVLRLPIFLQRFIKGIYSGLIRYMRMGNKDLIIHQTATNQLAEMTWSK